MCGRGILPNGIMFCCNDTVYTRGPQVNKDAIVLATFHATEIWMEDLKSADPWLPEKCLMRNTDGELCSWWAGLVSVSLPIPLVAVPLAAVLLWLCLWR